MKKEIMEVPAADNDSESSFQLTALLAEAKRVFVLDHEQTQHGPEHWRQVERNAIMLAEKTPGCDTVVARMFALLHDCKRQNEGSDPEHGARAAAFAQELHDRGVLGLDPGQLATLKFAMKHHNGGQVSGDPTIGVCWDADRLDLPRVGTRPDAKLLCTRAGKEAIAEGA